MKKQIAHASFFPNLVSVVILMSTTLISGCVTLIRPEALQVPAVVTCVALTEAITTTHGDGHWKPQTITRLERGPYWSEKADERGTFFRAPKGGISNRWIKVPSYLATYDGGFYVPNDPSIPPTVYWYFSVGYIPPEVPPEGADCSNLTVFAEASAIKANPGPYIAAGSVAGATGGVIGRSAAGGGSLSYGQSAGAGAVGGAIGGAIAAAAINADVGKIRLVTGIEDPLFAAQIRALAEAQTPLKRASAPELTGESAPPRSDAPSSD